MKSKISLVVLLVVIIFLGALSFFLGYKYLNEKDTVKALNSQVEILKNEQVINEQNSSNTDNTGTKVVEKLAIPKFNSSKVDYSKRDYLSNAQESASVVKLENTIEYRKGPAKNIQDTYIADDIDYQFKYKEEKYNFGDANIVDVRTQRHGGATDWYIIVLLDDGTIRYAFNTYSNYETGKVEFKEYELKDVVSLVNLGATGQSGKNATCIGAITSDGVTHILPYDMP